MTRIKELKKELAKLEKEEELEKKRKNIPFMELAEIGQSLKVSDEARLKYEELFTNFALEKIASMEERYNTKRKKFVFKMGFE